MGMAKAFFDEMTENERDTAAFNVMIDGYVKLGEMGSAKMLFDVTPEKNVVSWTTMIDGYCSNDFTIFRGYGGFGALGHSVYHRELLPKLVEGSWDGEICHIATSGTLLSQNLN
ncbi:hypothetical protein OROMI_034060 [Orobanche minor]